jgi:membrane-associated protease RseP (regulator of RpoE activity)
MGGPGSLDPTRQPKIHFGADDNGSGTTALIELARRFGAMKDRPGRRLVFAAFSGEEVNLLGSAHYVSKPPVPLESTAVMINLDMVGRMRTDEASGKGKIEVGGVGTAKEFGGLVDGLAAKYALAPVKGESGLGPSDHASFYMKGVPVFFFFTGAHEDYHKPTDTVDRINFTGMATVVDAIEELAAQQATTAARPVYQKTAAPPMMSGHGGGPRLGIMPDYTAAGEGVRVAAVMKGGAAEKGGVKDGDRIVAIGGKPVKNMTAYMETMKGQKKGQPLEIVVERQGERVTVTVTPG